MASNGAITATVILIIVIAIGSAVDLSLLRSSPQSKATSIGTTLSSTASISTTTTLQSSSTTRSTTTNTTTSPTPSYYLKLAQAGSGPVLNSTMDTYMGVKPFPGDGPCCSIPPVYSDVVNYNDNGFHWTWQGDLNPGSAYASANSSGFTITYSTFAGCPSQESHTEAFDDCSFYGTLASVPSNATVFSVDAYIPNYSYYSSCQRDVGQGGSGCTYEILPYNEAALAIGANGNFIEVAFAEICNDPCNTNALLMLAYTSQGGSDVAQTLAKIQVPDYTPLHKLTIVTDRRSYIDLYVDNTLIYSNTTMPIDINGSGDSIQLSERTSINNVVSHVTWSNMIAYTNDVITANNLPGGSILVVSGPGNFSAKQNATTNGTLIMAVAPELTDLNVSIQMDGKTIASIPNMRAGDVLDLITTSRASS